MCVVRWFFKTIKTIGVKEMKKFLLGFLVLLMVFSLAACGQNDADVTPADGEAGEQEGVGNTDEGMVALALEQYFKDSFGDVIEEVVPTNIKVYTEEEIAADEALKDYTINEGDIVFSAEYELKISEDCEDLMPFTAGTGEIDGQWIRNKSNVGIARNNGEAGYSIDAFGTAF